MDDACKPTWHSNKFSYFKQSNTTAGVIHGDQIVHNIEKQTHRVSIGMPVYNGEKYIRQALDSILEQTYQNFELIISDNASTDATESICHEYASRDVRIRYFRQIQNIGAANNFQFVLYEASGEYFMWAAHDDYIGPPDYLSKLVSPLKQGFDFSFPNVRIINCDGMIVKDDLMNPFKLTKNRLAMSSAAVEINSFPVYGLFLKTRLDKNFKYITQCTGLSCFGEGLFVHSIFNEMSGAYIKEAFLYYRRHSENASSVNQTLPLLRDFLKFSYYVILYWIRNSNFDKFDTLRILTKIAKVHGMYTKSLILLGAKRVIQRKMVKYF